MRGKGLLLCLLGILFFAPPRAPAEPPPQNFDRLRRGMTPEEVRRHVGAPKRIARQILYHRHIEQWLYDRPTPVRLQFDCRRGQKPLLLWVSPPASH